MKISNGKKRTSMLIVAIMAILLTVFSSANSTSQTASANEVDLDPASKILCKFEDGQDLVRFYSTDYFHYLFRSKSAVTSIQNVDTSWLNKLLMVAGYDFIETNEAILGRELRPKEIPEKTIEEANAEAPKVSAFDRFGVSGLKWSSYQGEWKYYHINPCAANSQVSPTTFGTFYEDRLEPQSTHNEVSTSTDPRSIQFNKSVGSSFATAFTDTVSNTMFSLTKGIITLTIVFVGFSFTDLTTMLGMLNSEGESGGTASDVFTSLFDGLFSGFIFIVLLITAVYILYKGLIRRELRFALNTLIKTIAIFIIAVVMATNPSFWIGVPNKVATYGQALVLNTMSSIYEDSAGEASLCSSDVASIDEGTSLDMSNLDSLKSDFEKTNENMKSMIACNMWQIFLLDPWAKGQFGADYKDLSNDSLGNNNEDWVGTGSVPIGQGTTIDNWALFHLSTQTNAHAPVEGDSLPVVINNVNADWWRVVDAISAYEEEIEIELDEHGVEHEFSVPVEKKPTKYWESWIGNNKSERFGTAFISIVFGIVGSIAPLVFGVASAVFGLGITLLMMVSPVFFLLGLWGGRGDGIFFGWLSALINTVIKKVITGLLLILSLTFSMAIMNLIDDVGFIKSFLLMIIVSSLLIKNKDTMLNMLADVNFGGTFDPRQKANQFMDTQKKGLADVGGMTAAVAGGSYAAMRTGQNPFTGAKVGFQRQLSNKLYTSSAGMNIVRQMDIARGGDKIVNHNCVTCHKALGVKDDGMESAYRDEYGNYYCEFCAEEMGLENLYEVIVGSEEDKKTKNNILANPNALIEKEDVRSIVSTPGKSFLSHKDFKDISRVRKEGSEYVWDNERVKRQIKKNILNVQQDFVVFKNVQMRFGRRVALPPTPEPLQEYVDLALINMAWEEGRFDVIEATYKEAWQLWYTRNAEQISGLSEEEIGDFNQELEELEFEVGEKETKELLNDYFENHMKVDNRAEEKESIYVMSNGKLVLYNADIDKVNRNTK